MSLFRVPKSPTLRRFGRRPSPGRIRVRLLLEMLEDCRLLSGLPTQVPGYGTLPLGFEANQGQATADFDSLARGSGYLLALVPSTAFLTLRSGGSTDSLQLQVVGAGPCAHAVARDVLSSKTSYLLGNDPSQWRTHIPTYGKVESQNVYAGIDLLYYGNQGQLEYDFVVTPVAKPGMIQMAIQGAQEVALDTEGNLVVHTSGGTLVQKAPVIHQEQAGERQAVAGRFVVAAVGRIGFEVGNYDRSRPLVIDPILSYSTYLRGSDGFDASRAIAVDAYGNAYVTGETSSTDFPVQNPIHIAHADDVGGVTSGYSDAFVTKLNATGTALVCSTFLGGSSSDGGRGIDIDDAANAYFARYANTDPTNSSLGLISFPTTSGSYQPTNGGDDLFVVQLVTRPALTIDDNVIVEGTVGVVNAQFTVRLLDGNSQTVSVTYSAANGSATSGADYVSTTGTLVFYPGEISQAVSVSVIGDSQVEANETLFLNLSVATNVTIVDGQGVATIRDDDTTKFYVVDDATADRTFEYADPGNAIENYSLASGNTAPRCAASNSNPQDIADPRFIEFEKKQDTVAPALSWSDQESLLSVSRPVPPHATANYATSGGQEFLRDDALLVLVEKLRVDWSRCQEIPPTPGANGGTRIAARR